MITGQAFSDITYQGGFWIGLLIVIVVSSAFVIGLKYPELPKHAYDMLLKKKKRGSTGNNMKDHTQSNVKKKGFWDKD
jgi:hypothetical protein